MTILAFAPRAVRTLFAGLSAALLLAAGAAESVKAQDFRDATPRIAVVSAFAPELEILKAELRDRSEHSANGVDFATGTLEGHQVVLFLSGISVVNAAMTAQLALERITIERIVFCGVAGVVDPSLGIGDVAVAERWGQHLEMLFAREVDGGWATMPFFEIPTATSA